MADTAYDSDKLREQIANLGTMACIKSHYNLKADVPFDKEQYKERHLVECFFQKNRHSLRKVCFKVSCLYLPCLHSYLLTLIYSIPT